VNGRAEAVISLFGDLRFAVFADSGQIYPNWIPQPLRSGFGFGFRYKTPVGPGVVDIAQGVPSDGPVRFYFTVGTI
jgi:outer membrane translocation and assembly module TamA